MIFYLNSSARNGGCLKNDDGQVGRRRGANLAVAGGGGGPGV